MKSYKTVVVNGKEKDLFNTFQKILKQNQHLTQKLNILEQKIASGGAQSDGGARSDVLEDSEEKIFGKNMPDVYGRVEIYKSVNPTSTTDGVLYFKWKIRLIENNIYENTGYELYHDIDLPMHRALLLEKFIAREEELSAFDFEAFVRQNPDVYPKDMRRKYRGDHEI
jgi:hypothetical protein